MANSESFSATPEPSARNLSRRTVVKSAAWAAPVVLAAVALPAAVASGPTLAPAISAFSGASREVKTFTLTPAPANGTYNLSISGIGWYFSNGHPGDTTTTATVTNGSFSVTIFPGQKIVTGTLSVTGANNSVSLTRTN